MRKKILSKIDKYISVWAVGLHSFTDYISVLLHYNQQQGIAIFIV